MPDEPKKPETVISAAEADERHLKDKGDDSPADEKSYYYDDAHGYEDFDPDSDDEAGED